MLLMYKKCGAIAGICASVFCAGSHRCYDAYYSELPAQFPQGFRDIPNAHFDFDVHHTIEPQTYLARLGRVAIETGQQGQ